MNHLNQEELVLSYYGERDTAEHLASCGQCRAELARIKEALDHVAIEVPEPDSTYEARTWERVSWRLRGEKKRVRRSQWMRYVTAAAVLALAFLAGLLWNHRRPNGEVQQTVQNNPSTTIQKTASSTVQQRDRILLVVVSGHFDESERVLLELTNLKADDATDISAERDRAQALLASNRLYRRTALDRGEDSVATILDELEPILLQIAHAPSQVSAEELRSMQKRVESKGLVMKLRVVRADVRTTSAAQLKQPNV